jgi:type IV pilus assembly protein PilC
MPLYSYKAVGPDGKKVKSTMEAPSPNTVINTLNGKGYIIFDIKETRKTKFGPLFGIRLQDVVTFSRQLSVMVSSGIRIRNALEILSKQEVFSSSFRKILTNMVFSLESGSSLAEAMKSEKAFDEIFVNLVEAGEKGGVLDKALEKIAIFYEDMKRLRDEVRSAMAYPIFVLVFAVLIIFVISFFVLPRLISVFGSIPSNPLIRFLLNANRVLSEKWPLVLAIVIALFVGGFVFFRTRLGMRVKSVIGGLIPVVRKIRLNMAIERFTKTLGILLESGVSVTDAIELSARSSENHSLESAAPRMIEMVKKGLTLKEAMISTNMIPTMVAEMVGTGEETGKLPEVLQKVSEFYDQEVRKNVKQLVSLIEPMMIVFVGGFIALLALTMYQTIFTMQQSIGG